MFAGRVATLDFEGSNIRLMVARRGEVTLWETLSLPDEALSEGQVLQSDQVGSALDGLFRAHKLGRGRVVTSITAQRAIARVLSVPDLNGRLLESTVQRKAKQEIPLPPHETDLSWKVVGLENGNLSVFVLAVPKDTIDRHMLALKAARIRPLAMDIKPLALVRAVNQTEAVIVNLEEHALTLVIVVAGVPAIVRTVPLPAAESSPQARVDTLGQELARTTKFYNEGHKERPLPAGTAVYVTGATFESPIMVDRLAAATAYPVKRPTPPLNCPPDLPTAEYSVNLGLAVKKL